MKHILWRILKWKLYNVWSTGILFVSKDELLSLFLWPAFLKQKLILQILENLRLWNKLLLFRASAYPLIKKLIQCSYRKPKELGMFFRSLISCLVLEFRNIWTFWTCLFPLARHLLMTCTLAFAEIPSFRHGVQVVCWIWLRGRIWVTMSSTLIFFSPLLMNSSCSISL